MKSLMLLLTTCTCIVNSLPPPHPDVLAVRREEDLLHPMLRSPVLRNPRLLQILPLTSLLHEGENLVYERETNGVARHEIYKVLTHAGLIPRRKYSSSEQYDQIPELFPEEQILFKESSHFLSQDALQYL